MGIFARAHVFSDFSWNLIYSVRGACVTCCYWISPKSFYLSQMPIQSDPFRCQFNMLISDGIQRETKVKQLVPRFVCGSRGNIRNFKLSVISTESGSEVYWAEAWDRKQGHMGLSVPVWCLIKPADARWQSGWVQALQTHWLGRTVTHGSSHTVMDSIWHGSDNRLQLWRVCYIGVYCFYVCVLPGFCMYSCNPFVWLWAEFPLCGLVSASRPNR